MRKSWFIILLLITACQPVIQPEKQGFRLQIHPDGGLFVGDQVSFEVIPPEGWNVSGQQVHAFVGEKELGSSGFGPFGVGQRQEATLWWVWDTRQLPAGDQTITFNIEPAGVTWSQPVHLSPVAKNPASDPTWASTSIDCCVIHYITGTDAERDLDSLKVLVQEQANDASARMDETFAQRVSITLLPRLLGHGGFAMDGIYVTYMHHNLTGDITGQVIHHEMIHILDARQGGGWMPSMLVEGLAVYLSGGHYKMEALLPRAAALAGSQDYIPLEKLVTDFYHHQHEISYLEAGALVEYLVNRYGRASFNDFYRHMTDHGDPLKSFDAALNTHFGTSLGSLEQDFQAELKKQVVTDAIRQDLHLTVEFYDDMRSYQEILDPSAYFLTAWLPDQATMQAKGITADILRSPDGLDDRFFGFLLLQAQDAIQAQLYRQAGLVLHMEEVLLKAYSHLIPKIN